jgi:murein DD-endopeptidase MepM/ murein hydrolase activator NlpD
MVKAALTTLLAGCAALLGLTVLQTPPAAACTPTTSGQVAVAAVAGLTGTQRARAGQIIATGRQLRVPESGIEVALAVAVAESGLRNLANDGRGGDLAPDQRDVSRSMSLPNDGVGTNHGSVGAFQQQYPWWGTLEQLMDPAYAARRFYEALLQVPGWQNMPLARAAQAVQRSAHADGGPYAEAAPTAEAILAAAAGTSATSTGDASSPAGCAPTVTGQRIRIVLDWALAHRGDAYAMGANGPTTWDCSSFTQAAYARIGIALPRTASAQRDWLADGHGSPVPWGQEQPGDLLFYDSYLGPNAIGHVLLVLDPTTKTSIEARSTRDGVGTFSYAHAEHKTILQIWRVTDTTANGTGDTTGWTAPLPPGTYRLSSGFGPRRSPGGIGSTNHQGQDLAAPLDTPIRAAHTGTVTYAGPMSGYGHVIIIESRSGGHLYQTRYGHMYANGLRVRTGQRVTLGQLIGNVGNDGDSTGAHLHFEIRIEKEPRDPIAGMAEHGIRL